MSGLITQRATLRLVGNKLQRRQHDGREYAVVPATIIVQGVLNGELVPADEMAEFAERWNGRPVPLRHPTNGTGEYISSNDPAVIEQHVIGTIFNAEFLGDRVRAEMWIDTAKVARLGGEAVATLQRLDAGDVVEVSTGYYAHFEEGAGTFNGQAYTGIQRNLVPDHVALLPDEVGACSVANGCGAGRFNAATGAFTANGHDGVMLAFYLRESDAQALALSNAPAGVEIMPASELHVTLAYLGDIDEMELDEQWLLMMASDMAAQEVLVTTEVNGQGRFLNAPAAGADGDDELEPVFAICQSEALYRFRRWLVDWLSDYGSTPERYHIYLPHITLAYAPPGVDVPLNLERRTLVFDALAVSWGDRTVTFPLQGDLREELNVNEQEKKQAKVNPKVKAAVEKQAAELGTVVANEEAGDAVAVVDAVPATLTAEIEVEVADDVSELQGLLAEFGGAQAIREALAAITANAQQQKGQAIARIVANRNSAFSKADLEAMPLDVVLKLDRTLSPTDYSGAGGLATNSDQSEWSAYEAPKVS